jgi:hypothetical protein
MNTSSVHVASPLWLGALLGLLIPFLAYYLGIYMRYKLRGTIFQDDVLGLRDLILVGVLFSLFAVAPLLSAFQVAASGQHEGDYLLTLAVVIQAGLFMPESLARTIERRIKQSLVAPDIVSPAEPQI